MPPAPQILGSWCCSTTIRCLTANCRFLGSEDRLRSYSTIISISFCNASPRRCTQIILCYRLKPFKNSHHHWMQSTSPPSKMQSIHKPRITSPLNLEPDISSFSLILNPDKPPSKSTLLSPLIELLLISSLAHLFLSLKSSIPNPNAPKQY